MNNWISDISIYLPNIGKELWMAAHLYIFSRYADLFQLAESHRFEISAWLVFLK